MNGNKFFLATTRALLEYIDLDTGHNKYEQPLRDSLKNSFLDQLTINLNYTVNKSVPF